MHFNYTTKLGGMVWLGWIHDQQDQEGCVKVKIITAVALFAASLLLAGMGYYSSYQ